MISFCPKVSIIVTTFNRSKNDVLECLDSIRSLSYSNLELILVDNSTNTPSLYSSLDYPNMKLVDFTGEENLGVPGGRNVGIRNSSGDFLFFVDDDAVLDKNCVIELLKVARSDDSIGILGPLTYKYDNPSEVWFYQNVRNSQNVVDVPIVVGAALMIRRSALRKIGPFYSFYFLYHEELDLCYRVKEAGYRTVCVNKAICWHKVLANDSNKLLNSVRSFYWHRNLFVFAGKNISSTIGAAKFLFKNLVYYGNRNFPFLILLMMIQSGNMDALMSYFKGLGFGVALYLKFRSSSKL